MCHRQSASVHHPASGQSCRYPLTLTLTLTLNLSLTLALILTCQVALAQMVLYEEIKGLATEDCTKAMARILQHPHGGGSVAL